MVGALAFQFATDGLADTGAGAVATEDVFCADGALFALALAGDVPDRDGHGILRILIDVQAAKLNAVIGFDLGGAVGRSLQEVVEHACLVHDQVRELGDAVRVIRGTPGAHDVLRVLRVRIPEAHLGQVERFLDNALREAEGLERLHAAGLNTIRLADFETAGAALDEPGAHIRVLGQLGCGDHAGGTGSNDQDVHLIRQVFRTVDSVALRGSDSRILGNISVLVKLHAWLLEVRDGARHCVRLCWLKV